LNQRVAALNGLFIKDNFYQVGGSCFLLINQAIEYKISNEKISIDYIIISNNAKIRITDLARVFRVGLLIFDASNSLWKIGKWKQECDALHLRFHSIPEDGAFCI
jgi:competence protein ComEC